RDRAIAQHWDRVSQSCRLILYDRRGLGFSAAPDRGYSVVASMGDLRAVLDAAGAQRAILWGAADGGPLAIAFAVRHRDRVSGLLLLGTSPKLMNDAEFDLGINPAVIESFLRVDAIDRGRATEEILGTRHGSEDARAIMDILGRVPEHAWSKILGGIAGADVRSLLAEVRVPTLIVQHPENSYIPVESASYLHDHIVGSELLITEDYGAVPHFGETFYRAVERFIEQVTAQGAP
ncbi:MAG: alpha/beta hydrolase, partial [Dehalococcoidia bacterium]